MLKDRNGTKLIGVAAFIVMAAVPAGVSGQLIQEAARRAVGGVVRDAIGDGLKDAALDRTLDRAGEEVLESVVPRVIESDAIEGIETAMEIADVASALDNVMDAVETVNTIRRFAR